MIAEGKTLGELLFEKSPAMLDSIDIDSNKNNRVFAVQSPSNEGIANTSAFSSVDFTVSPLDENVNPLATSREQTWSRETKKLQALKEQNEEYRVKVTAQQKLINGLQKQLASIADTTRFEKYIGEVVGNCITGPLTMLPYVNTVVNTIQEYANERLETRVLTAAAESILSLASDKKTAKGKDV